MLKLRVFGINFSLSYLFLSLVTLAVFTSRGDSNLPVCILAAFLHELGHCILIIKYCHKPDEIVIKLADVKINCDLSKLSVLKEILINLAGPITNLIVATIALLMFNFTKYSFFKDLAVASFALGFFNLLPLRSLDGGATLTLLLLRKTSEKKTDIIITVLTVIILIPVAILGFMVLFSSKYNYSLLLVAIYIMLTLIL